MTFTHDFTKFPELTNSQLEQFQFISPHKQITEDFQAEVVKVIDGDTIRLKTDFRDFNFPMRILDINAKELNEGGEEAKEWMKSRIEHEKVEIKINQKNRVDKWGRLLGKIVHKGIDMGEAIRIAGLATNFKNRRENELPDLDKTFSLKQWF